MQHPPSKSQNQSQNQSQSQRQCQTHIPLNQAVCHLLQGFTNLAGMFIRNSKSLQKKIQSNKNRNQKKAMVKDKPIKYLNKQIPTTQNPGRTLRKHPADVFSE